MVGLKAVVLGLRGAREVLRNGTAGSEGEVGGAKCEEGCTRTREGDF